MKRIWSLFLSVSFLLAAFALPGTAYAATPTSGTCGSGATWTFDSATGVLKIEGSGAVTASEDWPSSIVRVEAGDQITSIADKTFESKSDLIEADLPGVTTIGNRAFYECKKLTKVNAPNVTSMGKFAFWNCIALQQVDFPKITVLSPGVFYCCTALQSVNRPNLEKTLSQMERYDQWGGSSYWYVGSFQGCSSLEQANFPKLTTVDQSVFEFCSALKSVSFTNIAKIPDEAFRGCSALETVNMPNVTSIGAYAFCSTAVKNVLNPDMTEIPEGAYSRCDGLVNVKLPNATSIGKEAFSGCSALGTVDAPNATSIGKEAFSGCSALQQISLPVAKKLRAAAFKGCESLTAIDLPQVVEVGSAAFEGCLALKEAKLPLAQRIDGSYGGDMDHLPEAGAFDGCTALKKVDVSSVIDLRTGTFNGCTALQQVVAPNLKSFGNAFVNCSALQELDISNYSGKASCFQYLKNTPSLETIRIAPDNAKYAVQDGVVLTKDLQSIVYMAPKNPIKNIDLPQVTRLEDRVFADCTNLETISLPNVTYIGAEAFDNCARLKEVRISDRGPQLTIGAKAFTKCRRLTGLLVDGSYENLWPKLQVDETAMDPLTHVRLMFPVTYDANGGTDAPAAERKVLGDDLTLTTREPRRSGYVFAGWSTTANGTVHYQPGDRYTADESATLYAVWQKTAENYTLHYSTDQGIPVPASQTAAGGTQVKLSTVVPRKSGYVFLGWADRQGGTPAYRAGDTYTLQQNTTLYAVWQAQEPAPEVHVYRTKVQPATWSADGRSYEVCDQCGAVRNTRVIAKAKTAALSAGNYTYDGKVKHPTVTVKDSKGKTLKKGTDYTVSYSSGCKNVGRYTVKVTLKGNYSGSKSMTYNINPKGTSVSKVTAAKKGFKVTWKKQATQTTGYEVQYSTSSNFKKGNKTVTISKNKTTSKSVSKLSAKKKYYVRVRTYKTVKINGKNVKFYSGWSGAKSVTTKK